MINCWYIPIQIDDEQNDELKSVKGQKEVKNGKKLTKYFGECKIVFLKILLSRLLSVEKKIILGNLFCVIIYNPWFMILSVIRGYEDGFYFPVDCIMKGCSFLTDLKIGNP